MEPSANDTFVYQDMTIPLPRSFSNNQYRRDDLKTVLGCDNSNCNTCDKCLIRNILRAKNYSWLKNQKRGVMITLPEDGQPQIDFFKIPNDGVFLETKNIIFSILLSSIRQAKLQNRNKVNNSVPLDDTRKENNNLQDVNTEAKNMVKLVDILNPVPSNDTDKNSNMKVIPDIKENIEQISAGIIINKKGQVKAQSTVESNDSNKGKNGTNIDKQDNIVGKQRQQQLQSQIEKHSNDNHKVTEWITHKISSGAIEKPIKKPQSPTSSVKSLESSKIHKPFSSKKTPIMCNGHIGRKTWGCQRVFSTMDQLKHHWTEKDGKICLSEFIDLRKNKNNDLTMK